MGAFAVQRDRVRRGHVPRAADVPAHGLVPAQLPHHPRTHLLRGALRPPGAPPGVLPPRQAVHQGQRGEWQTGSGFEGASMNDVRD